MYQVEEDEMYPAESINQIAQAHIADLHAEAREARLAASARHPRRSFRTIAAALHARPKSRTIATRAACTEAH